MSFVPDRAGFLELARHGRLAFVYREVLADTDTPVSAYAKLGRGPYSFLLESVVGGDKWAAYSFVGVRPRAAGRRPSCARGAGRSRCWRPIPAIGATLQGSAWWSGSTPPSRCASSTTTS